MNKELKIKIKHRRDTEQNWAENNPVLLDGELIIVDSSSGLKLKIGNGISSYSQLPFYGSIYAERPEYSYMEIVGLVDELTKLQNQISSISVIPSGMIMIWSGNSTDIPDGWTLCNGTNGAPDLTDKFVLGAGNTYGVGEYGGETQHTLTIEELPSHTHTYKRHEFNRTDVDPDTGEDVYGANNKTLGARMGTTEATGDGFPHNNMPPYYALCYIMKI